MAVTIKSRTYTNQFKPTSTTTWLLGNVGDWQKLTLVCEFAVEKVFDISDTLTINNPNELILNDGSTWGSNGFAIGMECNLDFYVLDLGSGSTTFNRIPFFIGNLVGSSLFAVDSFGNPFTTWGFQYGQIAPIRTATKEVQRVLVFSDQLPQGIDFKTTLLSNNQAPSGSLNSFIDGTVTIFRAENTDTLTIFTPTDFTYNLSFQSGLAVEKATVEYLGATGHYKNYKLELFFMMPCIGELLDFLNDLAPTVVRGAASITDNFEIIGYPVYNNPNCQIKNNPKNTLLLGNVGWFDENFNQLPNNFTFTTPIYTNLSGDVVSGLDYANPVKVTTTISGIPNLSGSTRFQYGFAWLSLEEDNYKSNAYPFHENYKVSTGGQAATLSDVFPLSNVNNSPFPALRLGYSSDGAAMNASDIQFVQNGVNVDVSITFRPNTAFATFMDALDETERKYVLWVSVGDQAPNTNQSDRVSLKLDFNTLQTFIEPIGAYPGLTIEFLEHQQDYLDTPYVSNSILIEDDLLAKVKFRIDTATGATIPIPTKIAFGVLVENIATGLQYVLDSNTVNLAAYPLVTQYNFDQNRGFKLGVGNDKNWFKVDYDSTNDSGTERGVLGWYGFKTRWEDWIKRFPVPPNDFYDNTQPQNGLNNDWYHYFDTAGYTLNFFVNITATLNGSTVIYQNLRLMTVKDYDVNPIITTAFKWYRDNAGVKGALLTGGTDPISGLPLGVIIDGENVWLDIECTRSSGTWASVASTYGINCIEVDSGAGQFEFRQLSSIWLPAVDNPLIPIPANTLAFLTLVSPTIIRVSCRVDSSKLIDSQRYKVTGRIGCL